VSGVWANPQEELVRPTAQDELVNPYVFVVGAGRSGTTLLQRMLDAHPRLAVVDEKTQRWLLRMYRKRAGLTSEGFVTEALVPMLLARQGFSSMGMSGHDLIRLLSGEKQPVRYERFVARIFDLYAARRGKPLAGTKIPSYVYRIGQIHGLWPQARFVHIVRDPRDVCLSMLDWHKAEWVMRPYGTWDIDPAVSTALRWGLSVAVGRKAGEALGPGMYHELRYEDLVASPDHELERICEFLRLPYAETMTRFYEGKTRVQPGLSSKEQWLPATVGLRDWRTQLDAGAVERIEAAVGELLVRHGYRLRFERCSSPAREQVAQVYEVFARNALAHWRAELDAGDVKRIEAAVEELPVGR
jgi:Sulfotransferase family